MKNSKLLLIVLLGILFASCNLFEHGTSYRMMVLNMSSDTLRVIIRGNAIDDYDVILTTKPEDSYAGTYIRFYDEDVNIPDAPLFTQEDFDAMIDSFSVFRRIHGEWIESIVPDFCSLDSVWDISSSYDSFFGYENVYDYVITDELFE